MTSWLEFLPRCSRKRGLGLGSETEGRRGWGKERRDGGKEKKQAANGWTDGHEADSIGLISPSEPNYPPNGQIYCSDEELTEGSWCPWWWQPLFTILLLLLVLQQRIQPRAGRVSCRFAHPIISGPDNELSPLCSQRSVSSLWIKLPLRSDRIYLLQSSEQRWTYHKQYIIDMIYRLALLSSRSREWSTQIGYLVSFDKVG